MDWRALNEQLVADSGGLGDRQTIFDGLKGKKFLTQIDLASGYHQIEIAEKDKYKTAFRDPDGPLYEFNRAGCGLTVLPSALTRIARNALRLPDDDVASWLDDILIASATWEMTPHLDNKSTQPITCGRLVGQFRQVHFRGSNTAVSRYDNR